MRCGFSFTASNGGLRYDGWMRDFGRYGGKHWRGELPLWQSFWVNGVGLLALLSVALPVWLALFQRAPGQGLWATATTLLVTHIGILAWQLVGIVRAAERHHHEHRHFFIKAGVFAGVILAVAYAAGHALYTMQAAFHAASSPPTQVGHRPTYSLTLETPARLRISGVLQLAMLPEVAAMLAAHPKLNAVVLDSDGGHLYASRGLARQFIAQGVDTYVDRQCSSACLIAYLSGRKRYLLAGGKLGFHQYALVSGRSANLPFYDLRKEQDKDLAYFQARGVSADFLQQVFETPASGMWFPDAQELLDAGVVHELVATLPAHI